MNTTQHDRDVEEVRLETQDFTKGMLAITQRVL